MSKAETANSGTAPDLMTQFSKLTKASTAHMNKLRMTTIYSDGEVAAKYKVMAAALWSVSARCEPCVNYYAREAYQRGVTEAEFAEFMAVATGMGGCVGETWALKAYKAYKEFAEGKDSGGTTEPSADMCQCG